jgi:hypothetical protein
VPVSNDQESSFEAAPPGSGALPERQARAAKLAKEMPLVHFPATTRFDAWSKWPDGLKSTAARGLRVEADEFSELRGTHVFVYAGPSCYSNARCIGDAAVYFDPSAEEGCAGEASPFDSGALEDPTPKLRPWKERSLEERWSFLRRLTVPLADFRGRFEEWLAASYNEPDRYLDTGTDRYAAGQPDRLEPLELLSENGASGYARYGTDCADRRAWTWEVRIAWTLPFKRVRVLHVPFDAMENALNFVDELTWSTGFTPEVEALPPELPISFETLYQESGPLLRRLIG